MFFCPMIGPLLQSFLYRVGARRPHAPPRGGRAGRPLPLRAVDHLRAAPALAPEDVFSVETTLTDDALVDMLVQLVATDAFRYRLPR